MTPSDNDSHVTRDGDSNQSLSLSVGNLGLDLTSPRESFGIDEAVARVAAIQNAIQSIEDFRLKMKWCLGFVLAHTERPRGSAASVADQIALRLREERGIRTSKPDLYRCEQVYRKFAGDFRRYIAWVETRKSIAERPVYWSDVLEHVLGGRNNPDVIGHETAKRNDLLDIERSIEKIEAVLVRAYVDDFDEETAGAIEGVRQSIEGMKMLCRNLKERVHEHTIPRSEHYLRFIRSYGCMVCNMPAEAHHAFGKRGTSVKPSDFTSIPLCTAHHRELHSHGRRMFTDMYEVDVLEGAFNLIHRFITGCWVSIRLHVLMQSDAGESSQTEA